MAKRAGSRARGLAACWPALMLSRITGWVLAPSAFNVMKDCWSCGTMLRGKMAPSGQADTQALQSMHTSGSINSISGASRNASTGQTSTQLVCLLPIQLWVTTYAMIYSTQEQQNPHGMPGHERPYWHHAPD